MKSILYPTLFIFILITSAYFADRYIGNRYKALTTLNTNWVWKQNGLQLDYVASGSSRVKSGMDILKLDSITGKNGLNIAEHGNGIAEQFLLTKRFVTHNKVKYLLLQVDNASLNSDDFSYPFHEYSYFPYFGDTLVDATVRANSYTPKYYFWRYIPLVKYIEFNSEYIRKIFINKNDAATDKKGFMPISKDESKNKLNMFDAASGAEKKALSDKHNFGMFRYNLSDSLYMDAIIKAARENGTTVILYTSPEHVDNEHYRTKIVPDIIKYYRQLSKKYNIPYFHFFNTPFTDNRDNISGDGLHLKASTIDTFSYMMADSIKNYMH